MDQVMKLAEHQGQLTQPMQWEQPEPLYTVRLPSFDTSVFPDWLRAYVEAVAHYTQTPADPAAFAALGVLSTVFQKKVFIRAQWSEPVNLYMILAHDPGNRKSAVFRAMTEPIDEWEREEAERLAPEIAIQDANMKELVQRHSYKISESAKAKTEEKRIAAKEEIETLALEIEAGRKEQKRPPHLYTDDVTGEKLAVLMAEQSGRMALLTAEGAGPLRNMAGRYDKQSADSSMAVYLKAHAGDDMAVDRIGRESLKLHKPALTLCLFLQPDTMQGLPPEFHRNGLMGRFLFSFPDSFVGRRMMNPAPVPGALKASYRSAVRTMLKFSPAAPVALRLSSEADSVFLKSREETEYKLLAEDGELEENDLRNWGNKLDGATLRLIGLIHAAKHADKLPELPEVVQAETVHRVLRLKPYLIQHAKKAHGVMEKRDGDTLARYLLEKITSRFAGAEEIKVRDINQLTKKKNGLQTTGALLEVLKILEGKGYLALRTEGKKGIVCVNPFFSQAPHEYLSMHDKQANAPIFSATGDNVGTLGTSVETHVPNENLRHSIADKELGIWGQEKRYPDGSGTI